MKAAGANLITLLSSVNVYAMADLYTFTLADATELKYTSASRAIGSFLALGPNLKRGSTRSVIGIEVDSLAVTLQVNADVQVANVPMTQFARNGGFDGARLLLERSFAASWSAAPAGNLTMFSGRVSDVTITGTQIDLDVKSDLELLDVMLPRNLYQSTCGHTLYDGGCGLNAANFTVTAAVTGNTSTATTLTCNLTQNAGYFNLGWVEFTSGQNAGLRRTIKRYTTGSASLVPALPYVPAAADTFEATPGCDKLLATCNTTFNNTANIRAFPFIPAPETAL